MPKLKPIAHAIADGRIAVYLGGAYMQIPYEAALILSSQLAIAIGDVERQQRDAGADHDHHQ